jgi:hypothetical protein
LQKQKIVISLQIDRWRRRGRRSPPWKRTRKQQATSALVIGALHWQERLVEVKREHVEERVARHSELRAKWKIR